MPHVNGRLQKLWHLLPLTAGDQGIPPNYPNLFSLQKPCAGNRSHHVLAVKAAPKHVKLRTGSLQK